MRSAFRRCCFRGHNPDQGAPHRLTSRCRLPKSNHDHHPPMTALRSKLDPRSDEFRANAQLMRELVADLRAKTRDVARGGSEEARAAAPRRAASSCRATASTRWSIRARRILELSPLAAYGMYGGDVPAASIITCIGARLGTRVRDRRQRRDGQGRHVLPDDGEEAPARAGDRAREPPALHLSRRFRRRVPARAGRRVSRTATTSAASSTTRRRCRRRTSRRSRWSWARARRAARTCRRCPTRRSSSRTRARSSSAGRRS